MEAKEEIRSRLNIEDVIGEYVTLKRAGRNFKGLSPFTSEKTPSFVVSPDKQIWHDFSSNHGGDVFSFVMEVEGLDFRGAMEVLARKAGVDLSLYQSSENRGIAKKKQRLLSALDLAASYYQQSLLKNQHALEYVFKKRGLSKEVVQNFRIGYSPQSEDGLRKALIKRGFNDKELRDAGLVVERRGRKGDMFRGRMMVPLSDAQGQVVGFTARLIDDQPGAPKYINTPQTLLYDKGRQLFGLHMAKEAVRTEDIGVIVEGNLDVVSSHQVGVKNVVAAAGTALTEAHLKSLRRLSGNVALAFDGDKAGIAATERAIDIAQPIGVRLTVITLPEDVKDPDELIQKSADGWSKAIKQAQPVVDWIIDRYRNLYDIKSAEGKKQITTRALQVINKLTDAVEREHYLQVLAGETGISEGALKEKLSTIGKTDESAKKPLKAVKVERTLPDDNQGLSHIYEDSLMALLVAYPTVRDAARNLSAEVLRGEARQQLLGYLQANPNRMIGEDVPEDLQQIETYVKIVLLTAETRYGEWSDQDRYIEAARLVRYIQNEIAKQNKKMLEEQLREAEAANDVDKVKQLKNELNALIKEDHRHGPQR